jgi:hypothetical protein
VDTDRCRSTPPCRFRRDSYVEPKLVGGYTALRAATKRAQAEAARPLVETGAKE